jgi:hypothetical protein
VAETKRRTSNEIGTAILDCAVHLLTGLKTAYLLNCGEAMITDGITRVVLGER